MTPRLVAVVMAATGVWFITSRGPEYPHAVRILGETAKIAGPATAVLAGLFMLVPFLKVAAAIGLWRIGRLSWNFAVVVLTVDLVTLAIVAVRFLLAAANSPGISELDMSGAAIGEVHSMWPTYIAGVLTGLCLLLLMFRGHRARAQQELISDEIEKQ